jgi:phosphatidyl-myo-inositol dimannoside synthase
VPAPRAVTAKGNGIETRRYSSMTKILLLTHEHPPFKGGIATVAHGLAAGAAAVGYDAHVLAPDYHQDTSDWDKAQPYNVSRFSGSTCSILSLDKLTKFAARCRQEIRLLKPDIVHAVDPAGQMALTALGKMGLVKRYFFTAIGTELVRYRNELFPRVWMHNAFSRVTGVSTISRYVFDLLVESYRVARGSVFVSYPGISPDWFGAPKADRARVREGWGVRPDEFVVITVARRVPDKGHQRVIEGLGRLPLPLRRRLVYVVAGPGPEEYARALAAQAESESVRALLLGGLSDERLIEACDAADLFVMLSKRTPTRLEGFGLVYLEAGARGLPSVGCDTGGVAEALRDRETGIVLPAYPPAERVAEALRTMVEDDGLRVAMGKRAEEFAAGFTWRRNAAEVYERFSEALRSRP